MNTFLEPNDNSAIDKIIDFHQFWIWKWILIGAVFCGLLTIPVVFMNTMGVETIIAGYLIVVVLTAYLVRREVKNIKFLKALKR